MKMLRNFKCSNNHITEKFTEQDDLIAICEECNEVATKMLSAPRVKGNTTGGSPSFSNKKH